MEERESGEERQWNEREVCRKRRGRKGRVRKAVEKGLGMGGRRRGEVCVA